MNKSKMLKQHSGFFRILFGLGLIMGGGVHSNVALALGCGDTIGPTGLFILDSDIGPCDDSHAPAALTVIGPVTLLMEGFSVICDDVDKNGDLPKGIVTMGSRARIFNGTVSGCDDGMVFDDGDGRHLIHNIQAISNEDDGFDVKNDKNKFIGNSAYKNGDNGFALNGNGNRLIDNDSNENADRGIEVDGDRNLLFKGNANHNGKDGIRLDEGDKTKVLGYTASDNGDDGIEVNSDQHLIIKNTFENNQEDGIQLTYKPKDDEVAENNKVFFNTARNNNQAGFDGAFDVEDQNPDCGSNKWLNNIFDTSNQECIH